MVNHRLSKFALCALLLLGPPGVARAEPGPPPDDGLGAWAKLDHTVAMYLAAPAAGQTWRIAIFSHEGYCDPDPVNWLNDFPVGDGVAFDSGPATVADCFDDATQTMIPDTGYEVWARSQSWCSATGTPCDDDDPEAEEIAASLAVFGIGLGLLSSIWGLKQVFRSLVDGRHE